MALYPSVSVYNIRDPQKKNATYKKKIQRGKGERSVPAVDKRKRTSSDALDSSTHLEIMYLVSLVCIE